MTNLDDDLPESIDAAATADAVSGIKDALGLILMALVTNRVVDGEKLAAAFLREGVAARHGPWARSILESCAETLRTAAAEAEMQDDRPPPTAG